MCSHMSVNIVTHYSCMVCISCYNDGNKLIMMKLNPAKAFQTEFENRRNALIEDTRKPESKRNETGNLWKHSLKKALEAAGFTVVLEKKHQTYKNGEEYTEVKSDLSVYKNGVLLCVIESKDYFSIDYVRRASSELSRIIKSYREQDDLNVIGIMFQGRRAYGDDVDRVEKECNYYDEDVSIVTMIDEKRRKVKNVLQTTINTDFDVKYDRIKNIVEKLNEII